jgi:hypothetical protein
LSFCEFAQLYKQFFLSQHEKNHVTHLPTGFIGSSSQVFESGSSLAGVFYNVKNGSSFITSIICQRISAMKTNIGVFVVLKTKHELK